MRTDRNKIAVEAVRLEFFLSQNQLVQAHGICSTLDAAMRDVIDSECKGGNKAEEHPYYRSFKTILKMKENILNGKQASAFEDLREFLRQLSTIPIEAKK